MYLLQPAWCLGIALLGLGHGGGFVAFFFARGWLVSALGLSALVWNAAFAYDLAVPLRYYDIDPGMERLWLNAAVDNIGDVSIRDSQDFPQPGRTLRFGVEANW